MTSWFPRMAGDDGSVRLFLFHYAGGGAGIYHRWPPHLPGVACQPVQLPGRQERRLEPPITDLGELIDALCDQFETELDDRPYALFGHSLGALVAYRLAVALERTARIAPMLLAVSGWAPEGFMAVGADLVDGPDDVIVGHMRALGAAPTEAFDDPRVLALGVPVMRADLRLVLGHVDDGAPVRCPIVAYRGSADPLLAPAAMASWSARTGRFLGERQLPGGHLFLTDEVAAITADLAPLLYSHGGR